MKWDLSILQVAFIPDHWKSLFLDIQDISAFSLYENKFCVLFPPPF